MAVVSGILFGAAVAVYVLSLYDRRIKKPYALAVAIVAAVAGIAEFAASFIPISQTCVSAGNASGTTTTTCAMNYANDPLALLFFILSLLLIVFQIFELTAEGIAAWP